MTEVFVIFVIWAGLDSSGTQDFHSVYATREAAEAKAAELRRECLQYPGCHAFLKYEDVDVVAESVLG